MSNVLSLNERLNRMADVTDLMLLGCVRAYMPPERPTAAIIKENKERMVA